MDSNKIKNARSVLKVIFWLIFFGSFWFMTYTLKEAYKAYKTASYVKTEIQIVDFKILDSGNIYGYQSSVTSRHPREVFKVTYKYSVDDKEYVSSRMNNSGQGNWNGEKDVSILFTKDFKEQFNIEIDLDNNRDDYILINQPEDTKPVYLQQRLNQYTPRKNYAYVNPKNPNESFFIHSAPEPLILAAVVFSIVICSGIGFAGYKLNLLKLA